MVHHTRRFSRDSAGFSAFLREKEDGPSYKGAVEFFGRHASYAPKDFSEMARASVSFAED